MFTDKDLERLKESLSKYKLIGYVSGVTSERLLALLARLSAAEALCEMVPSTYVGSLRKDWEKSCGREESK